MWQLWLIIAGVFFIFEMITVGFLVFWLGISALITMVVSFFVNNLVIQTTVFVVCSALLLFLTKPFVDKYVNNKKKVPTNAYSIIGKHAIVTKTIDYTKGVGQIKVGSEIWSAKPQNEEDKIEKDSEVIIKSIDGVKAIVRLVTKEKDTQVEELPKINQ